MLITFWAWGDFSDAIGSAFMHPDINITYQLCPYWNFCRVKNLEDIGSSSLKSQLVTLDVTRLLFQGFIMLELTDT